MLSEGHVLGLLVAANKTGGFTEQRRAAPLDLRRARRPRSCAAGGSSAPATPRGRRSGCRPWRARWPRPSAAAALLERPSRIQKDLGYVRVGFYVRDAGGRLRLRGARRRGPAGFPAAAHLKWALRGAPLLRLHGGVRPSWRCRCAPATAPGRADVLRRRARRSPTTRSTSSPPWPASSPWPSRSRRAWPRPSGWPGRWPPSTTWGSRRRRCATCSSSSRRARRRRAG